MKKETDKVNYLETERMQKALTLMRNDKMEEALMNLLHGEYEPFLTSELEKASREESNNGYWPFLLGNINYRKACYQEAVGYYEESYRNTLLEYKSSCLSALNRRSE